MTPCQWISGFFHISSVHLDWTKTFLYKGWVIPDFFHRSYLHGCDPPIVHGNLSCDTIFIQHNGLMKIGTGKLISPCSSVQTWLGPFGQFFAFQKIDLVAELSVFLSPTLSPILSRRMKKRGNVYPTSPSYLKIFIETNFHSCLWLILGAIFSKANVVEVTFTNLIKVRSLNGLKIVNFKNFSILGPLPLGAKELLVNICYT